METKLKDFKVANTQKMDVITNLNPDEGFATNPYFVAISASGRLCTSIGAKLCLHASFAWVGIYNFQTSVFQSF